MCLFSSRNQTFSLLVYVTPLGHTFQCMWERGAGLFTSTPLRECVTLPFFRPQQQMTPPVKYRCSSQWAYLCYVDLCWQLPASPWLIAPHYSLFSFPPPSLNTSLSACLSTYLPAACLPAFLSVCLPPCLPTFLSAYLPARLSTYSLPWFHAHLSPVCRLVCLPVCLSFSLYFFAFPFITRVPLHISVSLRFMFISTDRAVPRASQPSWVKLIFCLLYLEETFTCRPINSDNVNINTMLMNKFEKRQDKFSCAL